MAGNDVRNTPDSIHHILTNKEVIGIDQDALGSQGFKFLDFGDLEVWVKALSNGEAAFCFLNRSKQPIALNFDWKKFGIYHDSTKKNGFSLRQKVYHIKNLWTLKDEGMTNSNLKTEIAAHDVLMVRLSVTH
jgi:alpha-galactosidase